MIRTLVRGHRLQVRTNIFLNDGCLVEYSCLNSMSNRLFSFFLASIFVRRTASLSSNVGDGSPTNSAGGSSQISSSSSESLRTRGSCIGQNPACMIKEFFE